MRQRSTRAWTRILICTGLLAIASGGCGSDEPNEEEPEESGESEHTSPFGHRGGDAGADNPSKKQDALVFYDWSYDLYGYHDAIYLFLPDGSAYYGLSEAPTDFDVAAMRQRYPDNWREWRLDASAGYQIRYDNASEWSTSRGFPTRPGQTNQRLVGAYTSSSYSSSAVGGYASTYTLSFHADGTFTELGSFSVGTGGIQAANGVVGGASSSSEGHGTYRIDGYTITFQRDGKPAERSLFMFLYDDDASIYVGTSLFTKEKPEAD